jgi:outer membrane receptor protein involved in Fe transport
VVTNCPAPGSYFNTNPATWSAVPAACGYAPFAPADPYTIAYAAPDTGLAEQIWRESLNSNIRLTDSGLTLRLLAGWAHNTISVAGEGTASTDLETSQSTDVHERTGTYEADLISPQSQPFSWVVGIFHWSDAANVRLQGSNYSGGPIGVGPGYAVPEGGIFIHATSTKESSAVFGNVSYQFTPDLKGELGVRATWDDNNNPFQACASCPGGDANAFYLGLQNPANPLGPTVFPALGNANAHTNYALNLGHETDSFVQ